MTTRSVSDPGLLEIRDEDSGSVFFGCDQEWYRSAWQRMAGCGPTVVASILLYLSRAGSRENGAAPPDKRECLALMEDVWSYVTPTVRGIPSARILFDGALAYTEAKSLGIRPRFLEIPRERGRRPEFRQLLRFLGEALGNDTPAAFLNRDCGEEKRLDSWHWVTVVSLRCEEDGSFAEAEIADEGKAKTVDLAVWYRTTSLGGGLVRFDRT